MGTSLKMSWSKLLVQIAREERICPEDIQTKDETSQHKTNSGTTIVHFAAIGTSENLQDLIAQRVEDVNQPNSRKETPLHWAAAHSATNTQLVVSAGGNLLAKDEEGNLPLHWAAERGDSETVQVLLKATKYPQSCWTNENGETPLEVAIWHGNVSVVAFLLEFSRSDSLHYAILCEEFDIVQELVQLGFPLERIEGKTPYELALSLKHYELLPYLFQDLKPKDRSKISK